MSVDKICLIGDIVVDVTLKNQSSEIKLRMGGIVHAARCLWALNIPFAVRYFAPSYLIKQIHSYLNSLGCTDIEKLGNVMGAPYVFLIGEPKEIGAQGYEFLLHDNISIEYDEDNVEHLKQEDFHDVLLISGNYDLQKIAKKLNGRIHIDVANNVKDISVLTQLAGEIETVFVSTSSDIFKTFYENDFNAFCKLFKNRVNHLILKENRGGSRHCDVRNGQKNIGYAQVRPIQHSIGVGDSFDVVFISQYRKLSIQESLTLASWISVEYASTTYPDDFKLNAQRVIKSNVSELVKMGGVSLPWESRSMISIYLAAPDFDFVDVGPLEQIEKDLKYHNFFPRRPIKENGQMEVNAGKQRRQDLFRKDMELLSQCSIVVAVLLYNDPGTLIEIGMAIANGTPTFVYDPYNIAKNCMLTEAPNIISNDRDIIISEIFVSANKNIK